MKKQQDIITLFSREVKEILGSRLSKIILKNVEIYLNML